MRKISVYEAILSRRTIRQFKAVPISRPILEKIVNAARLAPSAANLQPLEYVVVDEEDTCQKIFPCLKWAAYISPQGNPKPGQEPVAYVVTLVNTMIREKGYEYDVGAAMENMILAAWGEGIGSCWIISIERDKVREILQIPDNYRIDAILSLGYPAEKPVVEELKDSCRYWKDESDTLHVPKRKLQTIVHYNKF